MLKIRKVLYPFMHHAFALGPSQEDIRMPTTCQLEFSNQPATRLHESWTQRTYLWGLYYLLLVVLGAALSLPAQVLSPPPRLEPTAIALAEIQKCGESISKSAPDISFKLLDAQKQLTLGLL